VQIEPGLQPQSRKNRSFSNICRHLAGLSAEGHFLYAPDRLAGDAVLIAPVSTQIPC
jgi:hypothetical protein